MVFPQNGFVLRFALVPHFLYAPGIAVSEVVGHCRTFAILIRGQLLVRFGSRLGETRNGEVPSLDDYNPGEDYKTK
jgi:hypothetical protein